AAPDRAGADWPSRLVALGWKQGSLVPPVLWGDLLLRPGSDAATTFDHLVVVTHSCDLAHARVDGEPMVEVLGARRLGAANPLALHLRNPRVLHAEAWPGQSNAFLEVMAQNGGVLPRRRLADAAPAGDLPLSVILEITEWLGRRYVRPAFPSAFVDRLRGVR